MEKKISQIDTERVGPWPSAPPKKNRNLLGIYWFFLVYMKSKHNL